MIDWPSLAIQIPLLVAFIWFVLELEKRFTKFFENTLTRMDKMAEAIDRNTAVTLLINGRNVNELEEVQKLVKQLYPKEKETKNENR